VKKKLLFEQRILLFSAFILSLCGIVYELVLGSLATYLLGNPVQQYSITIGVFLSSMGLGSYISRFITRRLLKNFISIEITLGITGGLSVIILNYLFSFEFYFYLLHVFFLLVIGVMVGLEIPLLIRILRRYGTLKEIISNVLTLDYLGGLAGSLLFPLILFPLVGRFLTSILIGIVNISIAVVMTWCLDYAEKKKADLLYPLLSTMFLILIAFYSVPLQDLLQKKLYFDDIVFSKRSKFQEIVLTRNGNDFRLYLDGSIQFSTYDEYRYHEMLVYPPLFLNRSTDKNVLVLGGGDGLAVREILKSKRVRSVVLVELDPEIINLARGNPSFRRINHNSLLHKKVSVVVGDAYAYLINNKILFNVIIADFPDPHDEAISKLYTVEFFRLIKRSLTRDGIFVTQSTSPLFAREAFWCIFNTMREVFPSVVPYHIYIPTFGEWGFNIASRVVINRTVFKDMTVEKIDFRFFSKNTFIRSQHFPDDCSKVTTEINTFNRPILYTYYLKGWKIMDF
jgi:spermidine synthase